MPGTVLSSMKRMLDVFIDGFYLEGMDGEVKRRIVLLVTLSLIGIFNLLVFGSLAFLQGHRLLGTADTLAMAFLALNLLDARSRKRIPINLLVGTVFIAFFYAFLFLTGGVNNTAFVWCYTFPLIASYLLGAKRGAVFTVLMTVPVLWHLGFDPGPPFAAYNADIKIRFLGSFLVVGLFSFLFEHTREKNRKELGLAYEVLNGNVRELEAAKTQLHAAKERAEAASVAKSRFLANMSHEIRTPMNGMLGMAELILATDLREDQRRLAEIINRSGESLLCVIDNILDISKIEAGKIEIRKKDFELCGFLESVVSLFGAFAQEKNLELFHRIGKSVPGRLRGDADRIRQVLMNLVNNAIKFTERGEVELEAEIEEDRGREVRIRFTVRDTGIGIAPEAGNVLFEPFTQADESSTRRHGGSGLGLSIAKQLVHLMGGTIGFASEPGKGATFWFIVPMEKPESTASGERTDGKNLSGLRVLVSGSPAACRFLSHGIAARGAEVQAVGDPGDTPSTLRRFAREGLPFDAVVLDMERPDADGLGLAEAIRRDGTIPPVLVVMPLPLRLYSSFSQSAEGTVGRVPVFLPKPVLFSHMEKCLRDRAGRSMKPGRDQTTSPECVSPPGSPGMRLLVVEDNPTNQDVLKSMLEILGFRCDTASNGREAVEIFSRARYDIVFMDCQMPVMDGFESTAELRRLEKVHGLSRATIVAVTGHAVRGDREKCLRAGMDDYLAKPYKMEQLRDILVRRTDAPEESLPKPLDSGFRDPLR